MELATHQKATDLYMDAWPILQRICRKQAKRFQYRVEEDELVGYAGLQLWKAALKYVSENSKGFWGPYAAKTIFMSVRRRITQERFGVHTRANLKYGVRTRRNPRAEVSYERTQQNPGTEDGIKLGPEDLVALSITETPFSELQQKEMREAFPDRIPEETFTEREWDILKRRCAEQTFQEIANYYNISSPRVEQLWGKILKRLRGYVKAGAQELLCA